MGSIRRFYKGRSWRIGRLVLGILLIATAITRGASSAPWSILLFSAIGLILSAVPWERVPWDDIVANIQQQKMSFETSGSQLMRAQKQDYANRLSIGVAELIVDTEMEKVSVILELSNDLLWDLSLLAFRGSAKLDSQTISQDLRLSKPASSYQLRRLRSCKIEVNFPIEVGIMDQLNHKREQENKAYWGFELEWKLKFSSGEEVVWRPNETQFEAVPSTAEQSR